MIAIALAIGGMVLARRSPPDSAALLTAAIAQARSRLPEFRERLLRPDLRDRAFFLRATLSSGKVSETLWLKQVSPIPSGFQGMIAEAPFHLPYRRGQTVEVEPAQVVDWTILERDGSTIGAFTQGLEAPVAGG